MGKSQETFNKKEIEKKKQQKKKDKAEKREERKANSSKSFEDMIAYVDEFGNITSTPQDPQKKKVVNQEDIRIGVSKQEDLEKEVSIRKGKVTFFNESKGYGFIKDMDSQESIFVHINGLKDSIKENDRVTFQTINTPKGLNAVEVKKA